MLLYYTEVQEKKGTEEGGGEGIELTAAAKVNDDCVLRHILCLNNMFQIRPTGEFIKWVVVESS